MTASRSKVPTQRLSRQYQVNDEKQHCEENLQETDTTRVLKWVLQNKVVSAHSSTIAQYPKQSCPRSGAVDQRLIKRVVPLDARLDKSS